MEIEKMKQRLQEALTEERYKHSLGVMKKAEELALFYGVDVKQAVAIGLMHDIAKNKTKQEYLQYAKDHKIEILEEDKEIEVNLHGIIGADLLKEEFGFTQEMQEAIKYHTTGRENMTMLDKILYVADKIEESRDYEGVESLRELSKRDLEATILKIMDASILKCIRKGEKIHTLTIIARNSYCTKVLP